eukprot:5639200-Amphidinium_carterae.1
MQWYVCTILVVLHGAAAISLDVSQCRITECATGFAGTTMDSCDADDTIFTLSGACLRHWPHKETGENAMIHF